MTSVRLFLIERYLCWRYYLAVDPKLIDSSGHVPEMLCKIADIQAELAQISGIFELLVLTPGLVLSAPYGRLVGLLGKKPVLRLSACSYTLAVCYFAAICYFHDIFDIRFIWLMPVFDIFGGGRTIQSSLLYSLVAHSTAPAELAGVLFKLSALEMLMGFLGMSIGSVMLRVNEWALVLLGIFAFSLAIPATFFVSSNPRVLEAQDRNLSDEEDDTCVFIEEGEENAEGHENASLLQRSIISNLPSEHSNKLRTGILMTVLRTITVDFGRSYSSFLKLFLHNSIIRTTLLILFLNRIALSIRVIFTPWASKTFLWRLADVAALNSFELAVTAAVLLSLPRVTRKYLLPAMGESSGRANLWIAKASLVANMAGIACIAVAPSRIFHAAALTVYTLGTGLDNSLQSFTTATMKDAEAIERLYLGMGMVSTVGGTAGTAVWSSLYAALVRGGGWWVRMPFVICVGLFAMAFWLVCRLHAVAKSLALIG